MTSKRLFISLKQLLKWKIYQHKIMISHVHILKLLAKGRISWVCCNCKLIYAWYYHTTQKTTIQKIPHRWDFSEFILCFLCLLAIDIFFGSTIIYISLFTIYIFILNSTSNYNDIAIPVVRFHVPTGRRHAYNGWHLILALILSSSV